MPADVEEAFNNHDTANGLFSPAPVPDDAPENGLISPEPTSNDDLPDKLCSDGDEEGCGGAPVEGGNKFLDDGSE